MTKQNKKGFTIIEVVLVLAIAGLIFLMVFVALPALQRSQRNTRREDDMSRVLTAVNDYQSNNNGKTPWENGNNSNNAKFVNRYIDSTTQASDSGLTSGGQATTCGDQFKDPDGECYGIKYMGQIGATTGTAATEGDKSSELGAFSHVIYVYSNAGCGDEGVVVKSTGKRQVALFFVEEGGAITCNDNH